MNLENRPLGKVLPFKKTPEQSSSLEQDADFQEALLRCFKIRLFEKKFGEEFYSEYARFDLRNGSWNTDTDSMMADPEIKSFYEETENLKNAEEILDFAKEKGLAFTPKETKQARKEAEREYAEKTKKHN